LIEKEKEKETKKEEWSLMTPFANIAKKESLKRDFNTLNSYFQLYNVNLLHKKSQKQHIVMLFPSLRKEQRKVNKNIFEKDSIFQNFYKNKRTYFCFIFFFFNFILKKLVSCLFNVYCRWIFDPGEK